MKKDIAFLIAAALPFYSKSNGVNRRIDPQTGANSFCIIGVIVNEFAKAYPEIASKETNPHAFQGTNTDLPSIVTKWAGIAQRDMTFRDGQKHAVGKGSYSGLRHANDGGGYNGNSALQLVNPTKGATFEELAKWLVTDKNYELV